MEKKEPIRILHVLGSTQLGGAESRIMDLYRHIDKNRVQFDFLVHTGAEGHFDKEIYELGGRIFRVPRFRLYNYFSYKKAMKDFFKEHQEFKAVQGHMTSSAAIYLPVAKKAGIPITIAHARSAGVDKGLKGILTRLLRKNLWKKTDYMFTCSKLAGISVFGKKAVEEGKTIFIPNAIDCVKFAYDEQKREKIRQELSLTDQYVIGHVGRFHYAKNHEYLIRIFAALCEPEKQDQRKGKTENGPEASETAVKQKKDYALILLGEGSGMEQAKALAKELGVEKKVHFLGNHSNVYDYYQAMDYFVYPSRYEGLPGTVVEAQSAGLCCVMSDTICDEVVVTELVTTMSIEDSPEKWAEYIKSTQDYERTNHLQQVQEAGFDVNTQTEIMTEFYESGIWK